ncbi:protein GPR107-like [Anneissia japonica]|uniref:protein GPR107-like n=1 Tax=Anneissia japonica TaxID=1529436 RepID=UPI00142594E4|nr:protein GPR107-like [Anneissia japonica]
METVEIKVTYTLNIVISLLMFYSAEARIVEKDVSISGYNNVPSLNLAMDRSFSFGEDSSLIFQLMCPVKNHHIYPDVYLLACSYGDRREVSQWNKDMLVGLCHQLGEVEPNPLDVLPCSHMKVHRTIDDHVSYYLNHTFERQHSFLFMMLLCPQDKSKPSTPVISQGAVCRSRLTTMNKERHLSMDEFPEPIIYKILLMVWAILYMCWIVNWTIYNEYSNGLHKFLFVAPTFKLGTLVFQMIYWRYMDSTGLQQDTIEVSLYMITSIEDLLLFITIMMAAEGWCVMRPYIKHCRSALIPIIFFFYITSQLCVIFANTYFLAFAISCIVFTIYRALKWSSESIELLQRQITITRHLVSVKEIYFEGNSPEAPLLKKLRIYSRLRQLIAVYTITYAVIITVASFLSQFTWVRTMLFEIPEFVVYVTLGYIFYLRDFSRYESASLELFQDNTVVMLLPSPNQKWPQKQTLMLGHAINILPRTPQDPSSSKELPPLPSPV